MRLLEEQVAWVWIGWMSNRASEGQAAGLYGAGFAAGSLAGKGDRGGMRGTGTRLGLTRS